MEAILGMLGVDKDEIMSQVEALIKQVNLISKNTEENRVMLTFLIQGKGEGNCMDYQALGEELKAIEKRYK
jgi:hypothetical protein